MTWYNEKVEQRILNGKLSLGQNRTWEQLLKIDLVPAIRVVETYPALILPSPKKPFLGGPSHETNHALPLIDGLFNLETEIKIGIIFIRKIGQLLPYHFGDKTQNSLIALIICSKVVKGVKHENPSSTNLSIET